LRVHSLNSHFKTLSEWQTTGSLCYIESLMHLQTFLQIQKEIQTQAENTLLLVERNAAACAPLLIEKGSKSINSTGSLLSWKPF